MAKRKSTTRNAASSALNWRRKVTETEEFEGSEEYIEECSDVEREGTPSDVFNPPSTNDHKNFRKSITRKDLDCRFLGDPLPMEVAMLRWPHRYEQKSNDRRVKSSKASNDDEKLILAKCHYLKAEVDGSTIFEINDDAYVKAEDDDPPYICKIIEIFEGVNGLPYFRAQWYYRSDDTVIKKSITMREKKRLFFSEMKNDNPLDCLIEKLKIVKVTPNLDLASKEVAVQDCDYYYDMVYLLPYSTYILPPAETSGAGSESLSTISCNVDAEVAASCSRSDSDEFSQGKEPKQSEMTLLDLYCGCGAMSSGLCLGANLGQTNLITKWAVDLNEYACESLALNHPETNVRNESVDDFLQLLKEWQKLCASFSLIKSENTHEQVDAMAAEDDEADNEEESSQDENEDDPEIFEVEIIIGICYGDPKESGKPGLHFKVRWKGYGPNEDSWEPVDGLGNCRERIGEFVKKGHKEKILPLPGDVDVVCGGPPCQGISGFNRFRNIENPLADPKNEQLMVFMDVVAYLQPRFILMENVVDLVRFSEGFLGRYAMGRLVDMNYQARMGIMAAGAYGLPQFRMRVFIWGAQPSEKLPQYPLPTHDVIVRGGAPTEFENIVVAYTEESAVQLENKLILGDAISDMPDVRNNEHRDEISYDCPPKTEFQRFIRLTKDALLGFGASSELLSTLYDHRPLELNEDDYQRVCRIPKKKGANFRDLPGVRVCPDDNKVEWDPDVKREFLPSGKPLVPDYAMTFVRGTSSKPFGRLWWDETVPTVVTRAEPHNQIVLHPLQDRVLTIRENARLQGFPDCYQLKGPVKQRYIQVGNAIAVPVARALGYALAMTSQGSWSHEPLFTLPSRFPNFQNRVSSPSTEYSS